MKKSLEEGDLVLCTVEKIIGTTVFVKLDDYSQKGTITFTEISPGRIRNIRDFVFPNKKIVCKILNVQENHVELSLRRVKVNERNDFNKYYKKERSYTALIKTVTQDKANEIINKIKENEQGLVEFLEQLKEDKKLAKKYFSEEQSEKINKILGEKKLKDVEVSRRFNLTSKDSQGIKIIKLIISEASKGIECNVSYLAAGKYLIKMKSKNPKEAESQINQIIEKIEDLSKKKYCSTCTFSPIKI